MSVFYNKVKRVNPSDIKAPFKWFPVVKSIGQLTERDAAWQMTEEVTLNPKEAEMAFYQLQKIMIRALLDGKTVHLPLLGTFCLTFKAEGVDSREEVSGKQVKQVCIRFLPSKELRHKLNKATLKPIEKLLHNS